MSVLYRNRGTEMFDGLFGEDMDVEVAGAAVTALFGNYLILGMAGCLAGGMIAAIGYSTAKTATLEIKSNFNR